MREHLYPLQSNLSQYSEMDILYIVDWDAFKQQKPKKVGGCCAYPTIPPSLEDGNAPDSVRVRFSQPIDITYSGLKTNDWRVPNTGQCDAILFPSRDTSGDAILFVELKYGRKENTWLNYKEKACQQLLDTVEQLEKRGAPPKQRKLYGLISFPLLRTDAFGASMYSQEELRTLYIQHQLQLYASNEVTYVDEQQITADLG